MNKPTELQALVERRTQLLEMLVEEKIAACGRINPPKPVSTRTFVSLNNASEMPSATSIVGLAPFNVDSGTRKEQRHIKGGRAVVRRVLYMAVAAAQRANADIKAFCTQLHARGKQTKVAFVAGMRKLLIRLNAVMCDGTSWNPPKA